jgi:hypothetical protein
LSRDAGDSSELVEPRPHAAMTAAILSGRHNPSN